MITSVTTAQLEQQWVSSIQLLTSCLPLIEMDSIKKSKLVACVGATGSGKTTCVLKLAKQAATEFGEHAVGVIALTQWASLLRQVNLRVIERWRALRPAAPLTRRR